MKRFFPVGNEKENQLNKVSSLQKQTRTNRCQVRGETLLSREAPLSALLELCVL